MKITILASVCAALVMTTTAFAEVFPLNGTYQPSASQGCSELQFDASKSVEILSDQTGILIKSGTSTVAGLPVSSFQFASCPSPSPCYNDMQFTTIAGYENNNSTFKYAQGLIEFLANPNPTVDSVLNGQYDVILTGKTLEITSTRNPGENTPAPKVTCILQKL